MFNTAVLEESFRGDRTNPVLKFIKERADPRGILLFKITGKEPYGRTGLDVWPSEKNAVIEFGLQSLNGSGHSQRRFPTSSVTDQENNRCF